MVCDLVYIERMQNGLYADSRDQLRIQNIRDCELEIDSPYNRSKDAFMSEVEDRFEFRAHPKLSTDVNS